MTRTYWLSFTDPHRPEGRQFSGVAIIDVSDQEIESALELVKRKFPNILPEGIPLAVASMKAHHHGCNPGGQMASWELPQTEEVKKLPKNRLLSQAEARKLAGMHADKQDDLA